MNAKQTILEYANLLNQTTELATTIDRLTAQKKELEYQMSEIKNGIKTQMIGAGKSRLVVAGWKINLSTSTSTVIEAEDELPEEFWKIEKRPDLLKVKDAIKSGLHVEGAKLVKNQNISLKKVD